jgi:hypothetical protein
MSDFRQQRNKNALLKRRISRKTVNEKLTFVLRSKSKNPANLWALYLFTLLKSDLFAGNNRPGRRVKWFNKRQSFPSALTCRR